MIKQYISFTSYSILLNGTKFRKFSPTRGLKQWNPILPYLFIITAKILSRLLTRAEANNQIHGIKVSRNAIPFNNLFYVDDVLFSRANEDETRTLVNTLYLCGSMSGQSPDLTKSSLLFSKNANDQTKTSLVNVLNIQQTNISITHLGNLLCIQRNKTLEFNKIIDVITTNTEWWRSKFLSSAGKATPIIPVIQASPIYTMSTFQVPTIIWDKANSLVKKFWWNANRNQKHVCAFINWKDVCKWKIREIWALNHFSIWTKLYWESMASI